jgi:heat-inducible transcriptional repressor
MSDLAFPGHLTQDDPDLTARHREVFVSLVALHRATARPVGSETLSHHAAVRLSPASIRGALGELEAMGLLERHHSSSGRQPSARGFEYFVRALSLPQELPTSLVEEIRLRLARSAHDVEALLDEASRLLSSITHQLGLAVASTLEGELLDRIDLEALGERRVLMVLNLAGGAASSLVLELESPLEHDELDEVQSVLRDRVVGLSLSEVRQRFASDPELVHRSAVRLVTRAAAEHWAHAVATPLFSSGTMHIAEQPEFASAEQLGPILRAVETGSPLDRLMIASVEGHAGVRVGLDARSGLAGCSLVSYALPGSVRAAVGVLGPVRMNYSYALAVVDHVGAQVAELLQS